jgi:hypothetical protein
MKKHYFFVALGIMLFAFSFSVDALIAGASVFKEKK